MSQESDDYSDIDWETGTGLKVEDIKKRNKACEGQNDIINLEPILENDGVELDKQCYSKTSLNNYINSIGKDKAIIPHNRRPMTNEDFEFMVYGGKNKKRSIKTKKPRNTTRKRNKNTKKPTRNIRKRNKNSKRKN